MLFRVHKYAEQNTTSLQHPLEKEKIIQIRKQQRYSHSCKYIVFPHVYPNIISWTLYLLFH